MQDLPQEHAADLLGITPRHLRRELPEAIHVLALRLWEQGHSQGQRSATRPQAAPSDTARLAGPGSPGRQAQVRQELASLQARAPGTVTDVREALANAVELAQALTSRRGIALRQQAGEHLVTAVHPSVLSQVLMTAIERLAEHMSSGEIALSARRAGAQIEITIAGRPVASTGQPNGSLIEEILAAQGGELEILTPAGQATFVVRLPSVQKVVLVVDDNPDLLHLYRRYVVHTGYHIVHTPQGQRVFELVEASPPDVIVLDAMLPDVDGWQLLADLHAHPATRSIPVIVCSVIRGEDLALSLGAACYLPKPVQRSQFIEALDRVLSTR